jgi:hypothetical protein
MEPQITTADSSHLLKIQYTTKFNLNVILKELNSRCSHLPTHQSIHAVSHSVVLCSTQLCLPSYISMQEVLTSASSPIKSLQLAILWVTEGSQPLQSHFLINAIFCNKKNLTGILRKYHNKKYECH